MNWNTLNVTLGGLNYRYRACCLFGCFLLKIWGSISRNEAYRAVAGKGLYDGLLVLVGVAFLIYRHKQRNLHV